MSLLITSHCPSILLGSQAHLELSTVIIYVAVSLLYFPITCSYHDCITGLNPCNVPQHLSQCCHLDHLAVSVSLCSLCSGLVAATVGTPADVVKTRYMNQTITNGKWVPNTCLWLILSKHATWIRLSQMASNSPTLAFGSCKNTLHISNYHKWQVSPQNLPVAHLYSGTSHYGHFIRKGTSPLRSPLLSPKLCSTVQISPL